MTACHLDPPPPRAKALAADLAALPVRPGDPASETVGEIVGELRWLMDRGLDIDPAEEAIVRTVLLGSRAAA